MKKLKPDTTIEALAASPLLDDLGTSALIVYLRLVAASAKQGRKFQISNRKLHKVPRTAARVIRELEHHKLVQVHFDRTDDGMLRTVELL